MLFGRETHKVDNKNRFFLPSKFRKKITNKTTNKELFFILKTRNNIPHIELRTKDKRKQHYKDSIYPLLDSNFTCYINETQVEEKKLDDQ